MEIKVGDKVLVLNNRKFDHWLARNSIGKITSIEDNYYEVLGKDTYGEEISQSLHRSEFIKA